MSKLDVFDLVFVITAVAFNLLIAGIFIADKKQHPRLIRTLGMTWLLLAIPLAIVFIHNLLAGQELWIIVCFGGVFLYMLMELLLDYVLKIEFRKKPSLHIPYIILEYIALFGLIGISFSVDKTWGYVVSISFWMLMASLIYLYWSGKKKTP
jgi:hypothetical protein